MGAGAIPTGLARKKKPTKVVSILSHNKVIRFNKCALELLIYEIVPIIYGILNIYGRASVWAWPRLELYFIYRKYIQLSKIAK